MANAYDCYSPFASVVITAAGGTRVPLFTNISLGAVSESSEKLKQAAGLVDLPFVSSVTVQMQINYMPVIELVLSPNFESFRKIVDSPLVECGGNNSVEVILGYSSGYSAGAVLSAPFVGLLANPPEVSLGSDASVTLTAVGYAGIEKQSSGRIFKASSRMEIIEGCVRGSGNPQRNIEIDSSALMKKDEEGNWKYLAEHKAMFDIPQSISQNWISDWAMVWRMVRESSCYMNLLNNTLRIFPQSVAYDQDPKYALRLFDFNLGRLGPFDPVCDGFPILAASTENRAVFLPASTRLLTTRGIDSRTGEISPKPSEQIKSEENVQMQHIGAGAGGGLPSPTNPYPDKSTGEGGAYNPINVNDPAVKEKQISDFLTNSLKSGIEMKVTTLGIPDLYPGEVVVIRGMGKRFDFDYGVFAVRHEISTAGYLTHLDLVSNTAHILRDLVKVKNPVNTKPEKPPEAAKKIEVTAVSGDKLVEARMSASEALQARYDNILSNRKYFGLQVVGNAK